MTTDQAYARLVAKADKLQAEGHHVAAHEWRRKANDLAHLASMAASLPAARRKR